MKKRQDACRKWKSEQNEGSEMYARAEQALVTFVEAWATLKKQPTIPAIPVEWMRDKMRGYASALKSTETAVLARVMQMWEDEQEASE
jgi:ferric-dicitrate binding protein FerR (iron transport regulator)